MNLIWIILEHTLTVKTEAIYNQIQLRVIAQNGIHLVQPTCIGVDKLLFHERQFLLLTIADTAAKEAVFGCSPSAFSSTQ